MLYKTIVLNLLESHPPLHRETAPATATTDGIGPIRQRPEGGVPGALPNTSAGQREGTRPGIAGGPHRPGSRPVRTGNLIDWLAAEPAAPVPPPATSPSPPSVKPVSPTPASTTRQPIAGGEKAKALDLLAAIKTLHRIEQEKRPATPAERETLARFPGFGPIALSVFPNPVTGKYKDGWREIGEELRQLLTPAEYESVKRTTFNQFFTSPIVMDAMHEGLLRLGVPKGARVLEPGCGTGNFMREGDQNYAYLGVELDSITGRIARALHPKADIRIEDFRETKLPELDGCIGNVPFADLSCDYHGRKFALHDYCFAKAVDALVPGGILALVTSHFTLDKLNGSIREYIAATADFIGAIRLPSDAFKREGTAVVTDIVFLRKRSLDEPPNHVDPAWLKAQPVEIDGTTVPINQYFLNHPEMVLGRYSSKDSLYGSGYSVLSTGDLAEPLRQAIERLPKFEPRQIIRKPKPAAMEFTPPPPEHHITEGSFFVGDDRIIRQVVDGKGEPVTYSGVLLRSDGTPQARRIAALIGLRDRARRVLESQNQGWPEEARINVRRGLNYEYDRFVAAYGPINKTTFTPTADGHLIRRMNNLVKFREDPDAMLVMSLEEYDETTGEARKSPILERDVVGRVPPVTSVKTAEEGLLTSLNIYGTVNLPFVGKLYGKTQDEVIGELGNLIYHNSETRRWETADEYLSGNVRVKLAAAEKAGITRNIEALRAVQPEDVLPGQIAANLGAPWIPASDIQAFAAELFQVAPTAVSIGHLPKDAVWSVAGDYTAEQSVAVTADYGTSRANGLLLLEQALNAKSPVIYDPHPADPEKRIVNQEQTLAAREKQNLIKERFKSWVFADPDRTERLVRVYNDTYNCMRPRIFDGSHLKFPGMSRVFDLRPHQTDAIWRVMSGGNTLLAHVVALARRL